MKIRTRGKQAFSVPNNAEGHKFIELLRKFRNRGWYYRARGRGSREHYGTQSSIEQAHAEWLAVYMEHSKEWPHSPSIAPWPRIRKPVVFTTIRPDHMITNDLPGNGPIVPRHSIPWPQPKEEDVAELTPEESCLLEDILESTFANWAGNISDEKQALLDTLVNKLID